MKALIPFLAYFLAANPSAEATPEDQLVCGSFTQLNSEAGEILSTGFYQRGIVRDERISPYGAMVPDHCRVKGQLSPVPGSVIKYEVWFPAKEWNGRLIGVGNGGFAGQIYQLGGLAEAVQRGYAAVATDTGHVGESAMDARWALDNWQKVVDFGYRAVHLSTVQAKAILLHHFGRAPTYSYFISCSNGGRQGLMEAQRYPEDYDGILVGAPAYDFTNLMMAWAWNQKQLDPASQASIPPSMASVIAKEVNKQCDHLDGKIDGLVSAPSRCNFSTDALLCGPDKDQKSCLSPAQAKALVNIYAGARSSNGTRIFAGWWPGGESSSVLSNDTTALNPANGWEQWTFQENSYQYQYATNFSAYLLGKDVKDLDFDSDPAIAEKQLGPTLNATNPDLSAFFGRGGKLLMYHGLSDAGIPAQSSVEYYQAVEKATPGQDLEKNIKLFLIPGMQHCDGGHGPSVFNHLVAPLSGENNVSDAAAQLQRWVEKGEAPDEILVLEPQDLHVGLYNQASATINRATRVYPFPSSQDITVSDKSTDQAVKKKAN